MIQASAQTNFINGLKTRNVQVYGSKGGLAHAVLQLSLYANVKDKQSLGLPDSYEDK